ncbi:hypothetical protein H0H92_000362 [Tricholoma furcatifolium]|nr:hypothetical protein H0H92_000362 [Tricholoma furcatifolium]
MELRDEEAQNLNSGSPEGDPEDRQSIIHQGEDITLGDSMFKPGATPPPPEKDQNAFLATIRKGYAQDKLFKEVLENPERYNSFTAKQDLLWTRNLSGIENKHIVCLDTLGLSALQNMCAGGIGGRPYSKTCGSSARRVNGAKEPKARISSWQGNYIPCPFQQNLGIQLEWTSLAHSQKFEDLTTCG